jgi:polyisoprenoid-binding protein YceI
VRTVLLGLLAVVVVGVGAAAWFVFGAGDAEPTVDVEDVVAAPSGTATDASRDDTTTPGDATASETETPAPTATDVVPVVPGGVVTTYVVDQGSSSVTYAIDEELRGMLTRVNGSTSEVATNVRIDRADLSTLELGDVAVNARTFETDYPARDQAVRGRILRTDDPANEIILFSPTSTSPLPGSVTGEFTVEVTGDLTVSGVTDEVTFPVTVTPEEGGVRLTGETTVLRSTYGLEVPLRGFVQAVAEEVILRIDLRLVPA